ncbi:hypothetical protein SASPL_143175 [Salvia splendens]|uniref:Lysophospholipid acyltransferase n=1 Tax=Salvia splendens TaxID=180675 RepID=A0A8X8WN47_SALSN|nr:hypothetical protein SASPL_143175 [Salvia splendens]
MMENDICYQTANTTKLSISDSLFQYGVGFHASSIGVSVPVLRFLFCFAASIPVSFFHRFVPGGPVPRHFYAAATGAFLSYLSFGFSSNLHFLVPMLLGYASMLLCQNYCGIITFFLAFGYLIGCIVSIASTVCKSNLWNAPICSYMSGDAWKEGGIDATGSLMGPSPSPYLATCKAVLEAAVCMGLYLYLVPHFPLSRFTKPVYQEYGFWKRLSYQYMSGFTARWKLTRLGLYPGYIIFFIQSATMIAGSRVLYRWQQARQSSLVKNLLVFVNFAYTLLILNYSCIGFMVHAQPVSLHETVSAYGSVYYIGTIVPIVLILLGKLIKPTRPARGKALKDQ